MITCKSFRVCALALVGAAVFQAPAMARCGTASWYHEGTKTANGERYKPDGITAAHRSLPFGTRVKVTHKRSGRSVVVRINDRGPFIRGRIIDLSRGAKRVIGMGGLAPVCLEILGRGQRHVSAKTSRRSRTASAGTETRTVYGTTQTSGTWARRERKASRYNRAAERRAVRHAREAARTEQRSSFKIAGWPGTDDAAF